MIKRVASILFVIILAMSLCACEASGGSASGSSESNEHDSSTSSVTATGASADTIDATLQGSWTVGDQGTFSFEQGSVEVDTSGTLISGTYDIETDSSTIICHLAASNGTVKIKIPYEYADNTLKLFNNKGEELERM